MGRSIDRQRPYPRLFEPGELDLRPTEGARLRQLARLPLRPATVREERRKESRQVMKKLRAWGTELAARFELEFLSIDPERESVIEHYGVCYEDGAIRIRLRHARTGRLLKESSLVDTLCHELAHLKYMDHGLRFRSLYQRILDAAREHGYYRPGPTETRSPRQGLLFEPGSCATTAGRG